MRPKIYLLPMLSVGLLSNLEAATGYHHDDYLVLLIPFLFISLVFLTHDIRKRIRDWRERKANEELQHPENGNLA